MPEPPRGSPRFPSTRWSVVLAAGTGAGPALDALCRAYWYPLYAHARRRGRDAEAAQDAVQGFFAALLRRDAIESADAERGRFRTFLLTAFDRFLINEAAREGALKRGGGAAVVSLDGADAERRYALEPSHERTPERLFLRDWALTVLDVVLKRLERDYAARGRADEFEALKGTLGGGRGAGYAEAARALARSENATRVAAHRLRQRYQVALREEVVQGLDEGADADAELRELLTALAL